ncbi:MAG: IS110 family transposase [Solirubrobacterales bacterium]
MNYVGIDWAYGRAAWCAMGETGTIAAEGMIPADEDGLARLVLQLGTEVEACVEMMSGAVWVRDRLEGAGWQVKVAHARKVRDVAPLACKTDKVDARVLAELCRRDLVPELWVPPIEDRALRERLRRRMHLVRTRTSARNRIFGLLTQFGLRVSHARLRKPDALELLESRGVPEVWRASIAELLELAEEMDRRIRPIDRELGPLARADERARLLQTMPGVGPLLGLTFAAEIGEVTRFRSAGKLVGYAGLAPRISQSGERSAIGALSKAGSRTLRWAAVEAANQAWRPSNPWHGHYLRVSARHGKNPAKSAVARKLLIAAWHMLSRDEPFKPHRRSGGVEPAPANSSCFLTA